MAYHDDLLEHAVNVVVGGNANQAVLRRAVSTTCYALFHLLVSETVANWSLASSRDALGRMFEHAQMKKASRRIAEPKEFPFSGQDATVVQKLRNVAQTFVDLQKQRELADYDNTKIWTETEAVEQMERALEASIDWDSIRTEKIAQDYLVSLLIKTRD